MDIFWYFFFTVLGLEIGSFLNVCIDRLPVGHSIVTPPSHCDACGRRLSPGDLIPVFSYLRTGGKCSYCGAVIPRRVLLVEIITGALFALLFWKYGLTVIFGITVFYGCVFLVLFFIDLETKLILNVIVYPMMPAALLISSLYPQPALSQFTSALIGGAAGFILFLIIALVSRGGMGFGDVKLAGLIGLAVGFPNIFTAIMLAILSGGLVAVVLLVFKIKKRKEGVPFGPFLAAGAMLTLLYGKDILGWYLGMLGW
jgi:leader peptidase (prepilin peptidase) / N-methyltransferase